MQPDSTERATPTLHMVWDRGATHPAPSVASGYEIVAIEDVWLSHGRPVVELDGTLTDQQWIDFSQHVVPDGMFMAMEHESAEWVGTASAMHNARGDGFDFPEGGEVRHVVVDEAHRGRGLGIALVTAAIHCLRMTGHRHIWLGVPDARLCAIRTYLRSGFVPFLHAPHGAAFARRWEDVYERLAMTADASRWLHALPDA